MTTIDFAPRVACDGLFNLRDLGGYHATDGRTVRWRTVFRADGLHRLTSDAAARMHDPVGFLAARYLEMTEEGAGAIAAAFELLAAPQRRPVVLHCAAGKDRTGVLAALLLGALGVDDGQIAGDYHLSAIAMEGFLEWIARNRPEAAEQMARQPRALLVCPPEAILTFLRRLRERHASVEGYLTHIGVASGTVASLRDALLVG